MTDDFTCYYNRGILCVNCSITVCEKCGWYEDEEKRRKAELRRIYGEEVKKNVATITFTADFTAVDKDKLNYEYYANNRAEDIRKALEQSMNSNTNYDQIRVRDFKVFLNEEDGE